MIHLIERAFTFSKRRAIIDRKGNYTYDELLDASKQVALNLLVGKYDLKEERVAFLVPPGFDYVRIQWGIWRAGGIAVPLCERHPLPSISYVIGDAQASVVIYSTEYETLLSPLFDNDGTYFISLEQIGEKQGSLPDISPKQRAMILYTSGTTGAPKGVVSTHANIEAQVRSLVTSWEWDKDDHILNVLPMHHLHGILNILTCALWSGACCEFLTKFDPHTVFERFSKGEINLFMAVPTIYFKLITFYDSCESKDQHRISDCLREFRLMVSGSAALPVSVMEQWNTISGHTLLERYGMTEIGMALSNPYRGERRPGCVGQALHGVKIRLADDTDRPVDEGTEGEIQVKGPNVFKEYWRKDKETRQAFTKDGWFKSGDIAILLNGSYKILGRNSVDIIKSGGYKISAFEIEEVLRSHPEIKDCGVVGIPDLEWGEIIGASLIADKNLIDIEVLTSWMKTILPDYKVPKRFIFQDDLPRNVMGKVTKTALRAQFGNN
jgi:malonyl-CoA/methylmalonyl-CoA synthetase